MTKLIWTTADTKAESTYATIHYARKNGQACLGKDMSESIMLIVTPEGKWALRYMCPGTTKPQILMGQAVDLDSAKVSAISAVPQFIANLRISQPSRDWEQRMAISWGPAEGGIIAEIK